jgi:hypothetical protein
MNPLQILAEAHSKLMYLSRDYELRYLAQRILYAIDNYLSYGEEYYTKHFQHHTCARLLECLDERESNVNSTTEG